MQFNLKNNAIGVLLLTTLLIAAVALGTAAEGPKAISVVGQVDYSPQIDVNVNQYGAIGTNNASLGVMLHFEWRYWRDSSVRRELARNASFQVVRIFSYCVEPCANWNDTTRTGTFSWANVDSLVQRIYEIGAQPVVALGFCDSDGLELPPGMKLDPTTGLPYPASFAAYCREWVKHFKTTGYPVKFYEIINEAWFYFYPFWTWYEAKASYFLRLFNTCYDAMHAENSNVMIGNDASLFSKFLNYWKTNGGKLDILTFHKYDSWGMTYSDAQGLDSADRKFFDPSYDGLHLTIAEARQLWGARLPAIATEANWGATYSNGTDPRIHQVIGAVWTALVLRGCILSDVDYMCYYSFSSSKSYAMSHLPQGYGFGLINEDNNKPWYPYYVLKMVGTNLAVGDPIVTSTSSSTTTRTLAWIHQNKMNLLVISRTNQPTAIDFQGFGGQITFQKIDDTVSWETPTIQTGTLRTGEVLRLKGYGVILFQTDI